MSENMMCPKCGAGLSLNTIILDSPCWYCTGNCGWEPKEDEDTKKIKKLREFINNIIEDLESNLEIQPTDVLYADMAGKLSVYKQIKKIFLDE